MVSAGFRLTLVSLVLLGLSGVGSAQVAEVKGTVQRVDVPTGTIYLTDGRTVRLESGTTLWQPVAIGSVVPGAAVLIRNAEPLDFRPGPAPGASRPLQMGTVASVDPRTSRVVLSDGTIVELRPDAQATFNGRPLALADLRPGDEIIVGLPAGSSVAVTDQEVSVLPRLALGVIEAESIQVVRRTQAP